MTANENAVEGNGALRVLAEAYIDAKAQADATKRQYDAARAEQERLAECILQSLDAAQLRAVRLDSGELLTVAERTFFRLPPLIEVAKRFAVFKWLRRVGATELIRNEIPHQTLSAFCRERIESGKAINNLIGQTTERYLSVRKG